MSIYAITSKANAYSEIKTALTANSYTTILYDDTVDGLVFSHSALAGVFRLDNLGDGRPLIELGTAHASAHTINYPNLVVWNSTATTLTGELIIGSDYLILGMDGRTDVRCALLFAGLLTNGESVAFGSQDYVDRYGTYAGYHLDSGRRALPKLYECFNDHDPQPRDSSGNALKMPLYVTTTRGTVFEDVSNNPSPMAKFELLLKTSKADSVSVVQNTGTTAILHGKYWGSNAIMGCCILGIGLYT